jgi:hypothetical protein
MKFESSNGDVATQRLAVDDGPAWFAMQAYEKLTKRKGVCQEPVWPIALTAISRGSPSDVPARQMTLDRGTSEAASSRTFSLIAVSE